MVDTTTRTVPIAGTARNVGTATVREDRRSEQQKLDDFLTKWTQAVRAHGYHV